MLTTSQKIKKIIEWGAVAHRISKVTGVPNNTVVRIWSGETAINTVKLENAEKIASYYDTVERNLSEAIAIVDWIIGELDPKRQRLSGNQNLHQKVAKQPFKVFEHLHKIIHEPIYTDQLHAYNEQLNMVSERIAALDVDIIDNVTISDFWIYYGYGIRTQLNEL